LRPRPKGWRTGATGCLKGSSNGVALLAAMAPPDGAGPSATEGNDRLRDPSAPVAKFAMPFGRGPQAARGTLWAWAGSSNSTGAKTPGYCRAYSIAEAASTSAFCDHVAMWVRAVLPLRCTRGSSSLPAGSRLFVSNLVEAHVLGSIRRHHGVPLREWRRSVVQRKLAQPHPLITAQFETDFSTSSSTSWQALNVHRAAQVAIQGGPPGFSRRVDDPMALPHAVSFVCNRRRRRAQVHRC